MAEAVALLALCLVPLLRGIFPSRGKFGFCISKRRYPAPGQERPVQTGKFRVFTEVCIDNQGSWRFFFCVYRPGIDFVCLLPFLGLAWKNKNTSQLRTEWHEVFGRFSPHFGVDGMVRLIIGTRCSFVICTVAPKRNQPCDLDYVFFRSRTCVLDLFAASNRFRYPPARAFLLFFPRLPCQFPNHKNSKRETTTNYP